ncbi:MAG: 4Fe-4S dicluster domain-containing protein [Spongiibacteraceae bacterium]
MNRRAFISYLSKAALLIAAALPFGLSRMLSPAETRRPKANAALAHLKLRPPGALQDDAAFRSACIGCGLCAEVCPPGCIQFYQRDGGDNANTPYIAPAEKSCVLCGKCMTACPTNALTETPVKEVNMGIAKIDRSACYPWVDRGVCGACASACPLSDIAIKFEFANMYRPLVTDACVGCGLCVEVCPHPSLPIKIIRRDLA